MHVDFEVDQDGCFKAKISGVVDPAGAQAAAEVVNAFDAAMKQSAG